MKGTVKQVAWAEDIIRNANESFDMMIKNYERMDSYGDPKRALDTLKYTKEAVEAGRAALMATLNQVNDAAMIINIRGKLTYEALKATVINGYMR